MGSDDVAPTPQSVPDRWSLRWGVVGAVLVLLGSVVPEARVSDGFPWTVDLHWPWAVSPARHVDAPPWMLAPSVGAAAVTCALATSGWVRGLALLLCGIALGRTTVAGPVDTALLFAAVAVAAGTRLRRVHRESTVGRFVPAAAGVAILALVLATMLPDLLEAYGHRRDESDEARTVRPGRDMQAVLAGVLAGYAFLAILSARPTTGSRLARWVTGCGIALLVTVPVTRAAAHVEVVEALGSEIMRARPHVFAVGAVGGGLLLAGSSILATVGLATIVEARLSARARPLDSLALRRVFR